MNPDKRKKTTLLRRILNHTNGIVIALSLAIIMMAIYAVDQVSKESPINSSATTSALDTETPNAIDSSNKPISPTFLQFTDSLFREWIQGSTLDLHYTLAEPDRFGVDQKAITFGDASPNALTASMEEMNQTLIHLLNYDYSSLTKREQLTYDILLSYLQTELSVKDLTLYTEVLGSVTGIQAQLPVLMAEYQFNTKQDIDDYIALLTTTDEYFTTILKLEQEKSSAGLFMSDAIADRVIAQCKQFITEPENNLLLSVFQDKVNTFTELSDEEKQDFINRNHDAVINHVIPAYQALIDGMTQLKGTGKNEGGLCGLPDGTTYYEYLVAQRTGSSRSITEIKNLINTYIYNDLLVMNQIYQKVPDIDQQVASCTYPLTDPNQILSDLQNKILEDFPEAVDTSCEIKYVDESLEQFLSPAFYLVPPIDKTDENVIYINGADNYDLSKIYTTLAHEGYPGHLYQTVYFNSVNTVNLRRLLNYSGYTEGWATYVEQMSYDMLDGINEDVKSMLSHNNSATLGLYALMDIGINYDGWSFEQLQSFIKDYFGIDNEDTIKEVYYTMIEDPANYLNYYVGYIEILELKQNMVEEQKENFSLKNFHEQLLSIGPAPFSIIVKYMK